MNKPQKMSNTRKRQLTDEEREFYRECGRRGGQRLVEEYGIDHMKTIGSKGGEISAEGTAPKAAKIKKPKPSKPAVEDTSLDRFI